MSTKLEFKNSPQDVTVRENLAYTFDLAPWLETGEEIASVAARLVDTSTGGEVSGVISGLAHAATQATLQIDWAVSEIKRSREYLLWIKAGIGTQFKEGFARFRTYQL